ncbi:MAG: lamin tail domain-containing protein [Candidatus Marinimicrobia bacterium]|nr:lamin tail domain-containing protein [Candidatus Neomarinimicrobiota bacterium]
MLHTIQVFIITLLIAQFSYADVFITELADPQNSSDAGRFVELYNNGDSDLDLSSGWIIQRWTNGNSDPTSSSIKNLTGTISAGGFYILCNDADKFSATYGLTCDQDIGTGGAADSNGNDNIAILDASGTVADIFGVPGEDGTGTGHEFEDGRAERGEGVSSGNATWDETEWNVDNDSGGGDGNQYAPEGYDPGEWIGASGGGSDTCDDDSACNAGSEGACEYPDSGYDCDGNCVVEVDCADVCGGDSIVDECGECGGDGSACAEPASNLFYSEHAEGSGSNKYFEVYNASDASVSLADYAFVNCSNGCEDWEYTNSFAEGASVDAGGVYVVCHSSADETGVIPNCNETRTLHHNGDDAQGLMHTATNTLLDVFGAIGDDPGSGWEVAGVANATKDHTLVRKSSVSAGNTDWASSAGTNSDDSEWLVFDQNTWDYMGSHPHDFSNAGCTNPDACNWDGDATEDDGSCLFNDCAGDCGGTAEEDGCGVCNGDGSSCSVNVTFSVDMNIEGVGGDVKVRTSTINGEYNPSDWYIMNDDDGDLVYTYTMALSSGNDYGYNFNNSDGSGYESGSDLGDCAGGNYGNDRNLTVGDSDMVLDAVCWESCDACPEDIPGCTDSDALNYDETATIDDGSCVYDWPEAANLFFSECAEGSSNNKYLEIYNAGDSDVDLSGYSLSSCSNGCNDGVSWDYPDNVTFEAGKIVSPGDVYVVCHGSADDLIQAECDQTFTYLSNGDDVFALTQIGSGAILDIIGTIGDDPGSGWEVAGVSNATKDHTLVRGSAVESGNGGNWEASAGDADDSEWEVYDQNTWDYLGFHSVGGGSDCTMGDVNGDDVVNVLDVVQIVGYIVDGTGEFDTDCADTNDDGAVNVLDVVAIVNGIVNGRTIENDASSAKLIKSINSVSIVADGYIGGIQMTLKHTSDFNLAMSNNHWIADYATKGTHTVLLIVEPSNGKLFTTNGEFEITEMIVANSNDAINSVIIRDFSLTNAYPNPFNPTTTVELTIPEAGHVSVMVYNINGQLVTELANTYMGANQYQLTWQGDNVPSGMYLLRAEYAGQVSTQKLMLLK